MPKVTLKDKAPMSMVLARKYRPARLADVVGQDIFVRIIRNGLVHGRLGQAVLLTGMRGIGKTTLARLIAKAVCCSARDDQGQACETCPSCQAWHTGQHMDVVEMDAASHTGVDDMRQILQSCQYRPVVGHKKVFIIDEVHMLSKSAFNALLKTLEEPPAHVMFLLATTEVQKVPATVISRCQHLPLQRLDYDVLAQHLHTICQAENVSVQSAALALLAQHSQGSARDALSMLERALAMQAGQEVTVQEIHVLLGLPDDQQIHALIQALVHAQAKQALTLARDFYRRGVEPVALMGAIMQYAHGQAVGCVHAQSSDQSLDLQQVGTSQTPLGAFGVDVWDRLFQVAQRGIAEIQTAPFAWLTAEMILLRMAYMGGLPTPSQILAWMNSDTGNADLMASLSAPSVSPDCQKAGVILDAGTGETVCKNVLPSRFEGAVSVSGHVSHPIQGVGPDGTTKESASACLTARPLSQGQNHKEIEHAPSQINVAAVSEYTAVLTTHKTSLLTDGDQTCDLRPRDVPVSDLQSHDFPPVSASKAPPALSGDQVSFSSWREVTFQAVMDQLLVQREVLLHVHWTHDVVWHGVDDKGLQMQWVGTSAKPGSFDSAIRKVFAALCPDSAELVLCWHPQAPVDAPEQAMTWHARQTAAQEQLKNQARHHPWIQALQAWVGPLVLEKVEHV